MQSLLVVDEAEVSRLTDEASRVTRLHAGLALLRDQQPQGAERRPGGWRRHVGRPHQSGGVGKGHEERTSAGPPATSGGAMSGQVGGDEDRLRGAEVLHRDKASSATQAANMYAWGLFFYFTFFYFI